MTSQDQHALSLSFADLQERVRALLHRHRSQVSELQKLEDDIAALEQEIGRRRADLAGGEAGPPAPTGPVDLRGSILYQGDLISPIDEKWDAAG